LLKGVQASPLRGSDPGAAASAKHLVPKPVRLDAMQAGVAEYAGEHLLQVDLAISNRWRRGWLPGS
jgi:hypothetical protein